MKHKGELLIDLCVRESLSKNPNIAPLFRERLLRARKFVLSEDMSSYLADLTCAPFAKLGEDAGIGWLSDPLDVSDDQQISAPRSSPQGRAIRRINERAERLLEDARHLARAPHAVTWIEYDSRARRRRTRAEYRRPGSNIFSTSSGADVKNDEEICPRYGWLIEQHPGLPTAFKMTEFVDVGGDAVVIPISKVWVCDDSVGVPWPALFGPQFVGLPPASVLGTGVTHYLSDRVALVDSGSPLLHRMPREAIHELVLENMGELRAAWLLLATINDIPVTFEAVRPSKGYVARGQYRRFLEHSVIHLEIPGHRSLHTLAARALSNLKRRAHMVRGHWRDHRLHIPLAGCEHAWRSLDEHHIHCTACDGQRIWIGEHERGDASIGFVTHDYTVERRAP